jgi:hypothetical protein
MKNTLIIRIFLLLSFLLCQSVYAWDHSIELGYGYSHDPNHTKYNNSGFLLSGDLYPIHRSPMTFWSVNGSLGQWHTTTPIYKNVTSAAISLGLRLYPFSFANQYPFYFIGTVGPAIISSKQFGLNKQAGCLTFQTNLGIGTEFKSFDVNFRLEHFSNAHLATPNEGYNILYLLSMGYLF